VRSLLVSTIASKTVHSHMSHAKAALSHYLADLRCSCALCPGPEPGLEGVSAMCFACCAQRYAPFVILYHLINGQYSSARADRQFHSACGHDHRTTADRLLTLRLQEVQSRGGGRLTADDLSGVSAPAPPRSPAAAAASPPCGRSPKNGKKLLVPFGVCLVSELGGPSHPPSIYTEQQFEVFHRTTLLS
jgi:hypothetical protein